MRRAALAISVILLFLLHQDVWFWLSVEPLAFGFLPIALSYHALFSVAAILLMWALVKYAWPSHLDVTEDMSEAAGAAPSGYVHETGRLRDKEDRI